MMREGKGRKLSGLICAKFTGARLYQTKPFSCLAGVVKQALICKQGTARVPEKWSFNIGGRTEPGG